MFWANKNVTIQRINTSNVFEWDATLKCRYSPKKFTALRELETKQNHITFNLFCKPSDLLVRDKVIDWDRSFIISGISEYWDWFWKHQEVLMLEMDTYIHEDIEIVKLNANQRNYDTVMWEWIWAKTSTTRTVKALVDSAKLLKGQFIKMIPGGKIEDTELVVTLFFPESVDKSDKIIYNGDTYEVKWIIKFPHQLAVWINKYIKDYGN